MAERITEATAESKIIIDARGFSIVNEQETIAQVQWSQIQTIYGYTRFINQLGTLCLDFVLPDDDRGDEQRIIVEEGAQGWSMFKSALEQVFPGLDKRWSDKAAAGVVSSLASGRFGVHVPKFVTNPTEVWKRKSHDHAV